MNMCFTFHQCLTQNKSHMDVMFSEQRNSFLKGINWYLTMFFNFVNMKQVFTHEMKAQAGNCPTQLALTYAPRQRSHLVWKRLFPIDCCYCCSVTKACPTLCDSMGCSPTGSAIHGDPPGKNTGEGCHAHLQESFPPWDLLLLSLSLLTLVSYLPLSLIRTFVITWTISPSHSL